MEARLLTGPPQVAGLEVELRAQRDDGRFFIDAYGAIHVGLRVVQHEADVIDRHPVEAERVSSLLASRAASIDVDKIDLVVACANVPVAETSVVQRTGRDNRT